MKKHVIGQAREFPEEVLKMMIRVGYEAISVKEERKQLPSPNCALQRSLSVIGDGWSLLIIRDAFKGKKRFSEFQKSLGLAKNILSARLRRLISEDIFNVTEAVGGSAFNGYELTEKGRELYVVLAALWQWGDKFCPVANDDGVKLVDRQLGRPLSKIELKSEDGRVLAPEDVGFEV